MENGNHHENIWEKQIPSNDQNKQFYHYQPMHMHGFDLQREITNQPSSNNTPDNVHFLRDNKGPFVKIYYADNNKEYELFDRSQVPQDNVVFMNNNADVFNNYLPNTQNQMPFQQPPSSMMNQQQHTTNSSGSNSVIHHLVTSNLGPGKFGTFGVQNSSSNSNNISNTFSATSTTTSPLNISIPTILDHVKSTTYIDNGSSSLGAELSPIQPIQSNNPIQPQMASAIVNNNSVTPTTYQSKKQRIVAEVKPMRMSYSDVVSKNGMNTQVPIANSSTGHSNSASSSPNTTMPATNKNSKAKYVTPSFEKKQPEVDKNRKSPTNPINVNMSFELKKIPTACVKPPSSPPITTQIQPQVMKKKKPQTKDLLNTKSSSGNRNDITKNQINNKYTTDSDEEEEDHSSTFETENDDDDLSSEFYDVHKNLYPGEHHKVEKIKTTTYKKVKQHTSATSIKKVEKEKVSKRLTTKNTKKKHTEFLQKIFASCIEYLYIFVKWLWMLVYDVGYLSFGIIWDRMGWIYQCFLQGTSYIRNELSGNPGRAVFAWFKNIWKKFDNKFDKKSKWAFWRWIFKKQSSNDNAKEQFKDGKLPKTAEEAMKSLLNCKEKDAYSILGVSPDCPQEQIKKHYKKIAVLVHPDKLKQAGAEEAFKVLQRSFELIGEPESRKQYDENLAKALHTEKAFNELNDLLIQLQTKISEAANTIRCSSCCFRHPRKPTGRKAFAARECSTCKIRHSAREGDIWAETNFFGLRWKYLALMEGNVYDITEWALCQRGALSHLQANSCVVQYKIVLGGNQQQNHQSAEKERDRTNKKDAPANESQEDFFLNNIYHGQSPQQQQQHQAARRRYKKN